MNKPSSLLIFSLFLKIDTVMRLFISEGQGVIILKSRDTSENILTGE